MRPRKIELNGPHKYEETIMVHMSDKHALDVAMISWDRNKTTKEFLYISTDTNKVCKITWVKKTAWKKDRTILEDIEKIIYDLEDPRV